MKRPCTCDTYGSNTGICTWGRCTCWHHNFPIDDPNYVAHHNLPLNDPDYIANRPRCEASEDYVLPTGVDLGPCSENCEKHGKDRPR